jgi:nucleotide-binding universal stress UspA family protein
VYDEILFPTDGSDGTGAVVAHAVAFAAQQGARLHAVSVVDTRDRFGGDSADATGATVGLSTASERAREAVAQVESRVDGRVPVRTAVEAGTPLGVLLEYVKANDIDAVVMGTHGRTGFGRWVRGSTTEQLVRRASVPVLTVPLGEEAPAAGAAPSSDTTRQPDSGRD